MQSPITLLFVFAFYALAAHDANAAWCIIWVDSNNHPQANFVSSGLPSAEYKCMEPCFEFPGAGGSVSCTWGGNTCSLVMEDDKKFHVTEGSVCPDLQGIAHPYPGDEEQGSEEQPEPEPTDEPNVDPPKSTPKKLDPPTPKPKNPAAPKADDPTQGVASANLSVFFLVLTTGGTLALIMAVFADLRGATFY